MTYGIFSMESGNALAWYDSEAEALEAAHRLLRAEPDAVESVALMEFDDRGHPQHSWLGQDLHAAAGGVAV